jgi:hypothetical protein
MLKNSNIKMQNEDFIHIRHYGILQDYNSDENTFNIRVIYGSKYYLNKLVRYNYVPLSSRKISKYDDPKYIYEYDDVRLSNPCNGDIVSFYINEEESNIYVATDVILATMLERSIISNKIGLSVPGDILSDNEIRELVEKEVKDIKKNTPSLSYKVSLYIVLSKLTNDEELYINNYE